jgi:tRNA uracil 4-sulfurtransferase
MKFVGLLSSGIDSPVAIYLLSKKADEIILVHADNTPFTDKREIENCINLTKHLTTIISCPLKLYMVSHGDALTAFKKYSQARFTCVFCKRMLLRYAEKIAHKQKADAIIMGDSLGQVASQTLKNLNVVEQAITLPVLRPVVGFDKEEIISIAKDIKTFDLSIVPSDGCSAVPPKPSTQATLHQILEEENKIDIKSLVENAVEQARLIVF